MGIKSWGIFQLMSLSYELRVQVSGLGSNVELLLLVSGNAVSSVMNFYMIVCTI